MAEALCRRRILFQISCSDGHHRLRFLFFSVSAVSHERLISIFKAFGNRMWKGVILISGKRICDGVNMCKEIL